MPRNSVPRMAAIQISVMPALRLRGSLEGRDAVGDGLDAGEGRGAAGEGVQDQEGRDGLARLCTSSGGGLTTVPRVPVQ